MSSYRPIDSKREEFRKYLERAGVMDALTKVLVSLYEEVEKPDNALDYVRNHLGIGSGDSKDVETLKEELEASNSKIQALEEENAILKEKLAQFVPDEEAPAALDTALGEESSLPVEDEAESEEPVEEAPPEDEEEPNE